MRRESLFVAIVSFVVLLAGPAKGWSIIIELGKGQQVHGFLVEENEKELTIKTISSDGKATETKYVRSKIKIVHKVDRTKLAGLTPEKPNAYRELADALAKNANDPEARELARRLYLIAAHRTTGKVRRDCLLGMCDVANGSAEARRIRAVAFMLDPERDPKILKRKPNTSNLAWDDFRIVLRAVRNGKVDGALKVAEKPGVAECFAAVPDFLSIHRFQEMCEKMRCDCGAKGSIDCPQCMVKGKVKLRSCPNCSNRRNVVCPDCDGRGVAKELTSAQLRLILQTELRLEKMKAKLDKSSRGSSWSTPLSNQQVTPVRELSLDSVTEIDPKKCVYRDGKWVTP